MTEEDPVMDDSKEYPIATVLRSPLRAIVEALCIGDYSASTSVPMVEPIDGARARQIKEYIEDYGEAILALPEEAWATSRSRWMVQTEKTDRRLALRERGTTVAETSKSIKPDPFVIEPGPAGFLIRDPLPGVNYTVGASWIERWVAGGVWK